MIAAALGAGLGLVAIGATLSATPAGGFLSALLFVAGALVFVVALLTKAALDP